MHSGATMNSTLISTPSSVPLEQEQDHDLGPKKVRYKRNNVSFVPVVSRTAEAAPLRYFSAPTYSNDKEKVLAMDGRNRSGGRSGRRGGAGQRSHSSANGLLKPRARRSEVYDTLAFCQQLLATTLTDNQAEEIVYAYAIPHYTIESLVEALCQRMHDTVGRLAWNKPHPPPEWGDDLRFLGDWWMCLSDAASDRPQAVRRALDVDTTTTPRAVYQPLLDPGDRTAESEEQLVADLALRLQGPLYHLEVLHVDSLILTPDRLQVLLFAGLIRRRVAQQQQQQRTPRGAATPVPTQPRATQHANAVQADVSPKSGQGLPLDVVEEAVNVISFSVCRISTAGALILLGALIRLTQFKPFITTLDLSFNALTHRSLRCFTRLLPLTRVVRLSLRGNPLVSGEPSSLRDFLREGAATLQELDLGHTRLSYSQVCALMECLPAMYALRVLLLDFVDVPPEKASALSKAIVASRLWHISLNGVAACASDAYMKPILNACARHRREALDGTATISSFFQRFFQQSYAKGWRPPIVHALPEGYDVFTNNDPSLYKASSVLTEEPLWLRDNA